MDLKLFLMWIISPVFLIIGIIKPSVLRPLFKKVPSRLEITAVSLGILVGLLVLIGSPQPAQKESRNTVTTKVTPSVMLTTNPVQSLTTQNTNHEASESTKLEDSYLVTRIVDGDTIKVLMDGTIKTIRLIGVDTPETVDPRKPVECFGVEASKKMSELLLNQKVVLEDDPSQGDKDKYRRLLRYVFLTDGTLVNEILIQKGFAYEYTYDLPYKYQSEFKTAQQSAQQNKRGLWSDTACDIPSPTMGVE